MPYLLMYVYVLQECLQMIKDSELRGFSPAMINTADGKYV